MWRDSVDSWFDAVASNPCAGDSALKEVLRIVDDRFENCSKTKLFKVQVWLKRCQAPWKGAVLAHIKGIFEGDFRREFRFSFDGGQVNLSRVSQTSCFFSLLRQALTYPS